MARNDASQIGSDGNRISVVGRLGLMDFHRLLAAIHTATTKRGYQDITLDFEGCTAAFAGPMLSVCATVGRLRHKSIDTDLRLPLKRELANLFLNTNWAYLIDPAAFNESTFTGTAHVPAIPFSSGTEQQGSVNRMMDAILSSLPSLERPDLAAIEWSLSEITDNVLMHSESPCGGFVQLNNFRAKRQVEFAVSDAGVGIPETLRRGHPAIRSDPEALDQAIREGVTRDKQLGQGNGLFGTFQIARVGGGYLNVHSGYARLDFRKGDLRIRSEPIPCVGTLVVACMDISNPNTLGEALRFDDQRYQPTDYIETHYEATDRDVLVFRIRQETASFGSRIAGTQVRTKLSNLVRMNPGRRIVIDFTEVPVVSSSFADEVFGKLFLELGALRFMQAIDFVGIQETVQALLDRAIMQRSRETH